MNRLPLIDPTSASGKTAELLGAVKKKMGLVPNLVRGLANSPVALQAYLDFSGALQASALAPRLREQVALVVAEINSCEYCLAAHTLIGGHLGLSAPQLLDARRAEADDARSSAVLKLAREITLRRGEVRDADLRAAREAGVTDAELAELVGIIALNVFTNYFNHLAQTAIDFPAAPPLAAAAPATIASTCSTSHAV